MQSKSAKNDLLYNIHDAEEVLRRLIQQELNERKINPRRSKVMSTLSGTSLANENEEKGPWTYMTAVLRRIDAEVASYKKREIESKEKDKNYDKNLLQRHTKELADLKAAQQKEIDLLKDSHQTQIQEQLQIQKADRVNFEASAQIEIKVLKSKHKADLHEAKEAEKIESKKEWKEFLANLSISQDGKSEPIKVRHAREHYELVLRHAKQLNELELEYQNNLKLDPGNKGELRANYLWERSELIEEHKQEIKSQKFMHRQELRSISEVPKEKIKTQKLERLQELEKTYKFTLAEAFSIQFSQRTDFKIRQIQEQNELLLKLAHEIITKKLSHEKVLEATLSRQKMELREPNSRNEFFLEYKRYMPKIKPETRDDDNDEYPSPK
jgi:hypothetical protein